MEKDTLKFLSDLSYLNLNNDEYDGVIQQLDKLISSAENIKNLDITYDYTLDKSISMADLREDIPKESLDSKEVLKNAEGDDSYFIVPKVIE